MPPSTTPIAQIPTHPASEVPIIVIWHPHQSLRWPTRCKMHSTCSPPWYVGRASSTSAHHLPLQGRRRHALDTLRTILTSPDGARYVQPRVASFWVPLLQLLYAAEQWIADGTTPQPSTAVSCDMLLGLERDVADVVGILGALAARPLAGVPVPSGIKGTDSVTFYQHPLGSVAHQD